MKTKKGIHEHDYNQNNTTQCECGELKHQNTLQEYNMKRCLRCGQDVQEESISEIGRTLANFVCDNDRRSDLGWDFYTHVGNIPHTLFDMENALTKNFGQE